MMDQHLNKRATQQHYSLQYMAAEGLVRGLLTGGGNNCDAACSRCVQLSTYFDLVYALALKVCVGDSDEDGLWT
jgi:hypothetical protein